LIHIVDYWTKIAVLVGKVKKQAAPVIKRIGWNYAGSSSRP
jgi:hypothetical protein